MQIAYKPIRNVTVFLMIIITVYFLFDKWSDYNDSSFKAAYIQFDSLDIKGEIEQTGIKQHMISFKLLRDNNEYMVAPYINKRGQGFDKLAVKGDSIIKLAHSNILTLKKGDKVYDFSFKNLLKD